MTAREAALDPMVIFHQIGELGPKVVWLQSHGDFLLVNGLHAPFMGQLIEGGHL